MTVAAVGRRALGAVESVLLAGVVVYMIVPSVLVVVLSFGDDSFIKFPPSKWGWRQYDTLFHSHDWLDPALRSLGVATVSALLATLIGLAAVLAMHRLDMPGRNILQFVGIGPLLVPGVAYAVALYAFFAWTGLLGTPQALVLAHTTIAVPFVLLIAGAAIVRVPRELEAAAHSLGASQLRAWRDVTLPLLLPAIAASFIFAFVTSFDEAVLASFLGYQTLPVAIFNSVRFGIDPVITAIATILTLSTGGMLTVFALLQRTRP
jgi:ABC-type spermidine/putrescine transport system permease subunit II